MSENGPIVRGTFQSAAEAKDFLQNGQYCQAGSRFSHPVTAGDKP